ncbi:MAG: outer membrane protein [Rhodomicrobiaceae bacterium]
MRNVLIAALAATIGMSTSAHAADLGESSYKDEPVVYETPRSWTGIYLGAGVGAGAVVHELDASYSTHHNEVRSKNGGSHGAGIVFDGIGGEGAFGTLQLGYDRQLSSRFVIGAFVDYDFSDITTDLKVYDNNSSFTTELELDHMWSVGARLGWLTSPDTMLYALIAYTQGEFNWDDANFSLDTEGWTLGAGIETMLSDNWSIKGEYRFTQFDSENVIDYRGFNLDIEPSVHTARVVLSYRINPFERSLDPYK